MTIRNVSRRTSKAMYLLSTVSEDLSELLHEVKGDDNLKLLLDNLGLIEEAQRELVKILAQDHKVMIE